MDRRNRVLRASSGTAVVGGLNVDGNICDGTIFPKRVVLGLRAKERGGLMSREKEDVS